MKSLIVATIWQLTLVVGILGISDLVREGTMAWYYWAVPLAMVALFFIIAWGDGRTPVTAVTNRKGAEAEQLPRHE